MIAEIFYTSSQEHISDYIAMHLKSNFDKNIEVRQHMVDLHSKNTVNYAWRYVSLLQSAIHPSSMLELSVKETSLMGIHFYFEIYHPISSISSYESHGITPFAFSSSSTRGCIPIQVYESARALFPAVALREQMVLIPNHISSLLSNNFVWLDPFKSLRNKGVEEIDFSNKAIIMKGLEKAWSSIEKTIIQEVRSTCSYRSFNKRLIPEISKSLKVSPAILGTILNKYLLSMKSLNTVAFKLKENLISCSKWTKVDIQIDNLNCFTGSKAVLTINGPVKTRPSEIEIDLKHENKISTQIAIKANEPGEFPLEFKIIPRDDYMLQSSLPAKNVWVVAS